MPKEGKLFCVECAKPVDPTSEEIYVEMYGWSKYRGKVGGTNALKWKRQTGRVLCPTCSFNREHGTPEQRTKPLF